MGEGGPPLAVDEASKKKVNPPHLPLSRHCLLAVMKAALNQRNRDQDEIKCFRLHDENFYVCSR